MAIYATSVSSPAGYPSVRRAFATRFGGGAGNVATAPAALDPSGLVPVNRVQPMAGDPSEAQRLTENRLGTMPPSSFSGAGAGFVPVDRGGSPVMTPAVVASDAGMHTQQYGAAQPISAQATRDVAIQSLFGGRPTPTPDNPTQPQTYLNRVAQFMQRSDYPARRQAMLDRLQQRMPPEAFAALQQRLAENDARRAAAVGTRPAPQSMMDILRQRLASGQFAQPTGGYWAQRNGLLGTSA